jgi:2'-5' RNA ligase
MTRLFVALNIPEELKEKIIVLRNSVIPNPFYYKWETPDKIHLTLKFIGEIEDNLVKEIEAGLVFISGYKPFNCILNKFGFFFSRGKPVILWLGFIINEEIFDLVRELNERLVQFGIEQEKRKFKPHLTLMRIKKNLDKNFIYSFENCKLPEIKFTADSVSLIKSELHPDKSKYTKIKNYNLMGGK